MIREDSLDGLFHLLGYRTANLQCLTCDLLVNTRHIYNGSPERVKLVCKILELDGQLSYRVPSTGSEGTVLARTAAGLTLIQDSIKR